MELLNEMLQSQAMFGLAIVIIGGVATSLGVFGAKIYFKAKKEIDSNLEKIEAEKGKAFMETARYWADTIVRSVEESFREANGYEKLEIAIDKLKNHIGDKVGLSEEQLEDLIESAYNGAKDGFKKSEQ